MREGEPADAFYVIRDGAVALETVVPARGPVTIETLHDGDLSAGPGWCRPTAGVRRARARDAAHAIAIDGACLRGKSEADPALGYDLMKRFVAACSSSACRTRGCACSTSTAAALNGRACLSCRPPFRGRRPAARDRRHLDAASSSPPPATPAPFAPGQFAMLYAFGAGEAPISVSGIGGDGALVHTVRAVGAVTDGALRRAARRRAGRARAVRDGVAGRGGEGPDVVDRRRRHRPRAAAPVVHELLAHRERYGQVSILYGGRSPAELLYTGELESWRGRFDVDVDVTVDAADADWHGRVGVVTAPRYRRPSSTPSAPWR